MKSSATEISRMRESILTSSDPSEIRSAFGGHSTERDGAQSGDYPFCGQSIVCFAGEDWWYHHPHSKNHILKRLAHHNRVLIVNSITMGLPSVGDADFFKKIRRKLRSYLRWLRKVPEGLWVMTPINVPLYGSPVARALNRLLLILQLRLV